MANLSFNKSILGGRITHELELKQTPQGTAVLSFSIAVGRKNDKEKTDFLNLKAFGKVAENISRYFRKGSSIFVVGNIQTNSWNDQNGNKRYSTEVAVDEFYFVDSKNEVASPTFAPTVTPKFEELANDDTLPF